MPLDLELFLAVEVNHIALEAPTFVPCEEDTEVKPK